MIKIYSGFKTQPPKLKRIFLSPPHLGDDELKFVKDAFESNYIAPLGPQVDAFEREFSKHVGIKYCLALSSGTAAMHLALRHLGVGPGDEVIASTLTFIGSVSPIIFQGASPVFVDADPSSWNMDTTLLAKEMKNCAVNGKLPKAVIPTDLYGQCADYDQIQGICDSYNIPVIIDAAESLGATYKNHSAGAAGCASIFSFNGNKIITTSGGGMLASNDKKLIDHARKLSQQAREPLPYYEHTEIGYNYRMSNILAAIGRGQLNVLHKRVKRKREVFNYYEKALGDIPGIEFMPEATYGKSNRWLTVILITAEKFGADIETVRVALETENIESRPVWNPMHLQPVFRIKNKKLAIESKSSTRKTYNARVVGGDVAKDLFNRGLCLPSGTAMIEEDLNRVVSVILSCQR
ncbi:MAG: DegT/DnrJ/EryC1/StrS family aminotransferase [Desulfobacterales bacterium]